MKDTARGPREASPPTLTVRGGQVEVLTHAMEHPVLFREAEACRLLLAALDLLAACQAVVEQDGFVGSGLMRVRIEAMKAAIAKATG